MLELERAAAGDAAAELAPWTCSSTGWPGAVAAMAAAAGWIDVLVFTAGIGERSEHVRERVCTSALPSSASRSTRSGMPRQSPTATSPPESAVRVAVIRAREELVAARAAGRSRRSPRRPPVRGDPPYTCGMGIRPSSGSRQPTDRVAAGTDRAIRTVVERRGPAIAATGDRIAAAHLGTDPGASWTRRSTTGRGSCVLARGQRPARSDGRPGHGWPRRRRAGRRLLTAAQVELILLAAHLFGRSLTDHDARRLDV